MANNVREIAARADVSIATVSRVLHQSENVSPETRRRVEGVMEKLGLTAENLVRSAKTDTCIVGVLVPDLSNEFFVEIVQGIEEIAEKAKIDVVICHTHECDRDEIHYLRLLKEIHVCGIIITPVSDDDDNVNNEYLNLLSGMKIPVILIDRDVKHMRYGGVFIDNEEGAFEATKLLLENGHRKIAFIGGPLNTIPGRGRRKGYMDAFAKMKVPLLEDLIFEGDFTRQSGETITEQILENYPEATAVFSANNLMTLGCISALYKANLKIPEDMAVVGFDDIPLLEMLGIRITVVSRPSRRMGQQAMKMMAKMVAGRKQPTPKQIIMMPKLVVRGSERLCQSKKEKRGMEG